MDLALFDFDGTITDNNTFTPFIRYAVGRKRMMFGRFLLTPVIVGYKTGLVPGRIAREIVAGFGFRGRPVSELQYIGRKYATEVLPIHTRPEALERIQWHRRRGDQIVVVSASLDLYLRPWCERHKLELICSRLRRKNGLVTGRYVNGDCSGPEKARRIKKHYDLSRYDTIFAYGDTSDDHEMLALATFKYYQRW